ncbi:GNAT family N-acetyltransferase [Rhabdothermincola salaria]|uniref:GNAT family N-acetyltransferase n=1 Tax=Rhabdothermincola salaria TaxID=2903142 RepID=UPI001E5B7365|nr:N-acetyltransferase [Rhabdothermincola salaria]MCD9625635.1 N-acetyltransferase [Rhabdothermincola salaria]
MNDPPTPPTVIRNAEPADLAEVLAIERAAFDAEPIDELVENLLVDPTAAPWVSLLALREDRPVGHILFTKGHLQTEGGQPVVFLLAPLAVVPDAQSQGVGGRLIEAGLDALRRAGADLVFVLGHPDYYPRHGFRPAGVLGFEAPYPIPDDVADAWMVQELKPGCIGRLRGRVACATAMDRPEYWRE